jgi:hypothetical protein
MNINSLTARMTSLFCAISIFITPFQISAAYQSTSPCCQPACCEEECDPCGGGSFFKRNGLLLLGAAALGAAAGAGAGYAAGSGNRGRTGPAGPAGPAGTFATAAGSIDFTINITLSLQVLSAAIQPFVEAPDGTVYFGTAFGNALVDLGVLQSRTITVPSPAIVGTYHPGINVPTSILAATLLVSGTAVPSRGGSAVVGFPVAAIAIGAAAPEFQETAEFTYGPGVAPIIP